MVRTEIARFQRMIVILRRGAMIVLVPVVMRVIVGGCRRHVLPAERHHDRGERLQRQGRDQQYKRDFFYSGGHGWRF